MFCCFGNFQDFFVFESFLRYQNDIFRCRVRLNLSDFDAACIGKVRVCASYFLCTFVHKLRELLLRAGNFNCECFGCVVCRAQECFVNQVFHRYLFSRIYHRFGFVNARRFGIHSHHMVKPELFDCYQAGHQLRNAGKIEFLVCILLPEYFVGCIAVQKCRCCRYIRF